MGGGNNSGYTTFKDWHFLNLTLTHTHPHSLYFFSPFPSFFVSHFFWGKVQEDKQTALPWLYFLVFASLFLDISIKRRFWATNSITRVCAIV